jgi:hypothetical protein
MFEADLEQVPHSNLQVASKESSYMDSWIYHCMNMYMYIYEEGLQSDTKRQQILSNETSKCYLRGRSKTTHEVHMPS